MAFIGQIAEFDENLGTFDSYSERVRMFLTVNKVADELKTPAFLSIVGAKTFGLVKSLVTPDKVEDKSLDDLIKVLKNHFSPEPLEIVERFKFQKRLQKPEETCAQYMAVLKELSVTCNFGTGLKDRLRDQFVCGQHSEAIQNKLFTEKKLMMERALEVAISFDCCKRL